tara:strand:+ start:14 stop:622 length:609 start_codon:yes stop_codon:yes gene_type:complete
MRSGKIGIIDIGMKGNIFSIYKALEYAEANVGLIRDERDFSRFDKIILPGVGSFPNAIKSIKRENMLEVITQNISKKPSLGICLGFQILCQIGYEFQEMEGLNLLKGEVRKLNCNGLIPNMGFKKIQILKDSPILKDINEKDEFYFMHSFEMINHTDITSISSYNKHTFVSSVQKENIFGVQFHPEKSRSSGIKLFKNFVDI